MDARRGKTGSGFRIADSPARKGDAQSPTSPEGGIGLRAPETAVSAEITKRTGGSIQKTALSFAGKPR